MTPPGGSIEIISAQLRSGLLTLPACYTADVSVRRLLAAAIVLICIGVPLVESFDTWDQASQGSNDTEANVVFVALCVGLALTAGTTIVMTRVLSLAADGRVHLTLLPSFVRCPAPRLFAPPPTTSPPPTALRI
jgi:hypothetical protein